MKWHDGVRRIAQQQDISAIMPVAATNGAEYAEWVVQDFIAKTRDQFGRIIKVFFEKPDDRSFVAQLLEAVFSCLWQKQRQREVTAGIRQGDKHEATARPDVQRTRCKLVLTIRSGWDRQFLVPVFEQ